MEVNGGDDSSQQHADDASVASSTHTNTNPYGDLDFENENRNPNINLMSSSSSSRQNPTSSGPTPTPKNHYHPIPTATNELDDEIQDIKYLRHLHASEQQFKKRFNALKNIYEARITHLTSSIQNTFNTINTDELLQTMNADPTTSQFVPKAVHDLVQSDLSDERERFIHQLASKASQFETLAYSLKREKVSASPCHQFFF